MRKYKLISALAEETAKDVVRNEEMHCWVNKGAKGIELLDKLPDIFGQGVEIDNSEVVQTARRAKELLDKLAEYKPLAKVEELTEQNYNMIDGLMNNTPKKKDKNAPRRSVLKRLRNHQKKIASQGKGQPQQQKAMEEEMERKKK